MRAAVLICLLAGAAAAQPVDFARDVQPIFREHCYSCHGPAQQMGRFRLDRRRDAMRGGTIAVIAPGTAPGSRLFHKITGTKYGTRMPPTGPLQADSIAIIERWLDQGAPWPDALANDLPPSPADPAATRLMQALRDGRDEKLEPTAVKAKGPDGNTALHYAALYSPPATLTRLLAAGADPNAVNEAGATPLMWAVSNIASVKILLAAGAKPNVRSADGHTALSIAAGRPGSAEIVRALIAAGAKVSASQRVPMNEAANNSDPDMLRALLAAGSDQKNVPLGQVIRSGCKPCADVLLPTASKTIITRAVILAARRMDPAMLATLAEKGADIHAPSPEGNTLLHMAADIEAPPVPLVEDLLRRGFDTKAKNKSGQTPLDLAIRHGNTPVAGLLAKAGPAAAPVDSPPGKPQPAANAREALLRALPLLKKTDAIFLEKSGCVSCHHNNLFALTLATAHKSGIPVSIEPLAAHREKIGPYIHAWRERVIQNIGIPGNADTVSYILLGLGADSYPPDLATDALAYYLKGRQQPDGHWPIGGQRPPIEVSDFEVTAISLRALLLYAPPTHKEEYRQAALRAARYLSAAQASSNEDYTFQILGLHWAGQPSRRAAAELRKRQNPDGGWSQIPTLPSDAYATGQALFALRESGALKPSAPEYKKGVQFLINTQYPDGSWFVRSRSNPFQPYFETGFPFGDHQWISAAATNWAAMALAFK